MAWLLVGLTLLAAPGGKAPLGPDLKKLPSLVRSGDWTAAVAMARSIEERIAALAPLEVFDGQALAAPASGLGIYEPLAGGLVPGEELFLYAQVRNHGLRQVPKGWELVLVSDLAVLDANGEELARDEAFGESRFTAMARHRDTFVNVALRVKGLPSGAYTARLVINDRVKASSRPIDIPFKIP